MKPLTLLTLAATLLMGATSTRAAEPLPLPEGVPPQPRPDGGTPLPRATRRRPKRTRKSWCDRCRNTGTIGNGRPCPDCEPEES
jgi:hypothetical protein